MKKFLLVVFMGIVLAMNLYALVNNIVSNYDVQNLERVENGCTVVYVE